MPSWMDGEIDNSRLENAITSFNSAQNIEKANLLIDELVSAELISYYSQDENEKVSNHCVTIGNLHILPVFTNWAEAENYISSYKEQTNTDYDILLNFAEMLHVALSNRCTEIIINPGRNQFSFDPVIIAEAMYKNQQ